MNITAYYKISYGLYVVSTASRGKFNGYISNTVFQVSAEPAQLAVACSKKNLTAELIQQSGAYAISALAQETPAALIRTFGYQSGRDVDKFAGYTYQRGGTGSPILLDQVLAWFECEVVQTWDVGSHLVFIGRVLDNALLDGSREPLTYAYYREVRKGHAPANAPTYIAPEKLAAVPAQAAAVTYRCSACGYYYTPAAGDPTAGIAAGTRFEDLPAHWVCPVCGSPQEIFVRQD